MTFMFVFAKVFFILSKRKENQSPDQKVKTFFGENTPYWVFLENKNNHIIQEKEIFSGKKSYNF